MLLEEFVHTFILIEVILNIREYKKKLEKVLEVTEIYIIYIKGLRMEQKLEYLSLTICTISTCQKELT